MSFWWIANILLVLVVIPVVIAILIQVLTPIFQIRKYVDDIIAPASLFAPHLDEITAELLKTRDLVKTAGPELGRYARAVDNL